MSSLKRRAGVILWAIWTVRRKAIHEEVFQSPVSIHGFIDSFLWELGALAKPMVKKQMTSPGVRILPRWRPPPSTVPKLNVDAAVTKSLLKGIAAAIFRDHTGLYRPDSSGVYCLP
jgi:hypothetical protein